MENMLALVIGLVATTLTTVIAMTTIMKWMFDAQSAKFEARFDGIERRLAILENQMQMVLQHLLGTKSTS